MRFGRLWEAIRGRIDAMFGADERAEETVSAHKRSSMPRARRTGFLNEDAFAGELVRIKSGEIAPEPRLHVFSLSDFRSAVGPKWAKLGGLVEVAVESIIRRHVDSEKDIFTRLDAEIACLTLPDASRADTRTKVAAIARDISAHLFGDAVIDGRRPQVLAANLSLEEALTAEGEMDRDAIDSALAKAGAALAASLAAGGALGGAAGGGAPHRATLSSLMAEGIPGQADEPEPERKRGYSISGNERAPAKEPDWFIPEPIQPMRGADAERKVMVVSKGGAKETAEQTLKAESAPPPAPSWYSPEPVKELRGADAERRVLNMAKDGKRLPEEVMRIEGGPQFSGGGLSPDSALTLVWTPTWVTSRRAVGAFHARVIRSDKEGAPTMEGVHAYDGLAPIEALTLDRFVATQASRELKGLFYARQKLGLTIPVHWLSLSPKWRDCIRIPFEDCPLEARRKFLKIEVFGLTPAIPAAILRRMFEPLEKVGCDVMARLPLTAVDMIPALSHLRAVGVDLAELEDDERVGDDALFERLDVFRAAAKKARVASYVWGVRRRPLIARLVTAGFSLVNGPGVMCDLSHPALPSGKKPG